MHRSELAMQTLGLLLLGIWLFACSPNVRPCADGTVFVSVVLQGDTANADALVVDITVDGVGTANVPLPHEPGQRTGGLLVEFPKGYPTGKTVHVNITARLGSVVLGSGGYGVVITQSCHAVEITIAPSGGGPDLAGADLVGADLTPPIDDLTGVTQDLTGIAQDLALVDLTPPPGSDLTCVPAGLEDCFNNADDDCDGMVDCADPDCTGGTTPKAACVPSLSTGLYGTTIAGDVTCPSSYPQKTSLKSGFVPASCNAGTLSCTSGEDPGYCQARRVGYAVAACNGGSLPEFKVFNTDGCTALPPLASSNSFKWDAPVWSAGTCSATGSLQKVNATFSGTETFCASPPAIGAGCAAGFACVPTATNHCTTIVGDQATCPTSYSKRTTQYYLGIDDNLFCSYNCNGAQGACANGTLLKSACGLGQAAVNSCLPGTDVTNGYDTVEVAPPSSPGACGVLQINPVFDSTPTDPRTVCCTP